MMKQVWINIIDNAIKFSEASGTVEIEIKKEAVAISTAISNYGTEIPEESRKKVFEKFYQSDESHSSEGNGVGLAVVKRIVELHKGTVGVSCKDGKTTFTVSVPA
jgi:signal transduction histidine kinase